MFSQFKFYLNHSLNDLSNNKRLTFFALLSIAAGVAAIVSLQTLSLMIGVTLEENLQETNRGDVAAQIGFPDDEDGEVDLYDALVDEGILALEETNAFGQTNTSYVITADAIPAIQAWIDDSEFAGQAEFTYLTPIADTFSILVGTGQGTSITQVETGDQASQLSSFVIDSDIYPYYGDIMTLDGQLIADVLNAPTDIVIGENVIENVDIAVGDAVQLNGVDEPFIVRGIVAIEEAVQNPLSDIFAGLFGFYIIDQDSLTLFEGIEPSYDSFFFQLSDPTLTQDFDDALREEFIFFRTTTTIDLREDNEELVEQLTQLTTIMGLISLLIGSIGIVNTMQVIVRRRMLEVAVLKTLGMQGVQITLLFLTEAFLLGIIGSIVGILLGWAGTFAIKGVAESVFATTLPFQLAPEPAINGFIVGVIVATVFGFLPTLAAAQVRPGMVIRPQEGIAPRAAWWQSLLVIGLIVIVIALIAQTILGSTFLLSLGVVAGAFISAGLLYSILWVIIWIIGRFFPSFGIVDLKVSLRQMLASKGRGASTLLALVIGVFSLSTITLFADAINNVLTEALESSGGNVLISVQGEEQVAEIEAILDGLDGVNSYTVNRAYTVELTSWESTATGETYTADDILANLDEADLDFPPFFDGTDEERLELQQDILDSTLINTTIEAREITEDGDANMLIGNDLTVADATGDIPKIVFSEDPILNELGIEAGDLITYNLVSASPFGGGSTSEAVTFEVAGIASAEITFSFSNGSYASAAFFPDSVAPGTISIFADVLDEQIPTLRRELSSVNGAFALETAIFTRLITSLLGTFTAFPTLVAGLGLVVGGVVIANSVALATMERRSEIAVMKAVGLQRERVLGMILLENGILGMIGGLIGVGIGLVGVIFFAQSSGVPLDAVPWLSAFGLMMLCVGVAVLAAISSAWSASGEKPLTVLRYE
ncbi:MAG: FtsX-like permease family protein [Phototrophicaceae bacterium]